MWQAPVSSGYYDDNNPTEGQTNGWNTVESSYMPPPSWRDQENSQNGQAQQNAPNGLLGTAPTGSSQQQTNDGWRNINSNTQTLPYQNNYAAQYDYNSPDHRRRSSPPPKHPPKRKKAMMQPWGPSDNADRASSESPPPDKNHKKSRKRRQNSQTQPRKSSREQAETIVLDDDEIQCTGVISAVPKAPVPKKALEKLDITNLTSFSVFVNKEAEKYAGDNNLCPNCLLGNCGGYCNFCFVCNAFMGRVSKNVTVICTTCNTEQGFNRRPRDMASIQASHMKQIYAKFKRKYDEKYMCTNCYGIGHKEGQCPFCWNCRSLFDKGKAACPHCAEHPPRGTPKPAGLPFPFPYQLERKKQLETMQAEAQHSLLQGAGANDDIPWVHDVMDQQAVDGETKPTMVFHGVITPEIAKLLQMHTLTREQLIERQQLGKCSNCLSECKSHPYDPDRPETHVKQCNYCFTCHRHFKIHLAKCSTCGQKKATKRPRGYFKNMCRLLRDLDLVGLIESGFFCKNCFDQHVEDKCNWCFRCNDYINLTIGRCQNCNQTACTPRPPHWNVNLPDRTKVETLLSWLRGLGYNVIDKTASDHELEIVQIIPTAGAKPLLPNLRISELKNKESRPATSPDLASPIAAAPTVPNGFAEPATGHPGVPVAKIAEKPYVDPAKLPRQLSKNGNIAAHPTLAEGVRPSVVPETSSATTAVAFNAGYNQRVGQKISQVYITDNNSEPDSASMMLDGYMMYRDGQQRLRFKMVSTMVVMLESERFSETMVNRKKNFPGRFIIVGLPVELNPEAIEYVLTYVHGNAIELPQNDMTAHLEKLFIAANYFQIYTLIHQIRIFAKTSQLALDYSGMSEFITQLSAPRYFENFPTSIKMLPSQLGDPTPEPPPLLPPQSQISPPPQTSRERRDDSSHRSHSPTPPSRSRDSRRDDPRSSRRERTPPDARSRYKSRSPDVRDRYSRKRDEPQREQGRERPLNETSASRRDPRTASRDHSSRDSPSDRKHKKQPLLALTPDVPPQLNEFSDAKPSNNSNTRPASNRRKTGDSWVQLVRSQGEQKDDAGDGPAMPPSHHARYNPSDNQESQSREDFNFPNPYR